MLNVVHWPCNITKEESSSRENEWITSLFTDLNIVAVTENCAWVGIGCRDRPN
jgi:hypothetical protein